MMPEKSEKQGSACTKQRLKWWPYGDWKSDKQDAACAQKRGAIIDDVMTEEERERRRKSKHTCTK
jgi:hypothetical protein